MTFIPNIQPTKAFLIECEINSVPFVGLDGSNNFHVKELRVYEDICKTYFTAQLVIETYNNTSELYLQPTVPVTLTFVSPRSDGKQTKYYTEKFRVYTYDTKPIGGGAGARVEHTIQLIGQEYYNDRHNTVQINFANIPGTQAAKQIHDQYIRANGNLRIPFPSTGMIGQQLKPHEVKNLKPVKAIHDILDRLVFAQYQTCAPTYFRDKSGYVIAPLQYLLEQAKILNKDEAFIHLPAQGESLDKTLYGYNNIIHLRAVAPAGESSAAASAGEISGMINATSFFDIKTGNYINNFNVASKILNLPFINKIPKVKSKVQQLIQQSQRGRYGARMMFAMLDELMQARSVDKQGPGGYNSKQEAFLTTLNYTQKYWISVPMQTGLNITCGSRINIEYPINGVQQQKTLFVPRLIHELRFTETTPSNKRQPLNINGVTELYCVDW